MWLIIAFSIAMHACYIGSKLVVSLYALQMGAGGLTIGVLAALYALVPLILGIYAGRLTDTKGTRWPMLGGAVLVCAGMLASFFSRGMSALLITAVLTGAGFVFFNVAIQTLTGGQSRDDQRARNFSNLSIGYSVSTFIGPVSVGLVIDHFGHAYAFLMLALFAALPIIGLLASGRFNYVGTQNAGKQERSALDLLRQPAVRSIVIVSGLMVAAWDLFAFYLPVYAHALHFSATTIGLLLGTFAVAAFITRFAMPLLLRRWRAERVMFACVVFAAGAFAAYPFSTNLHFMLALTFCLGLGLGCGQPLSMMIAFNRSPEGRNGEVTGLRLTANNVARVVIPVFCGALGAAVGAAPVFWLNAMNLAAISLLVWRL